MKNKRDDSLKVATATGKKIVWERNKIHIFCCRNAFSPTHECNFAFCQRCHITKLEDGESGGLFGKKSRRSTSANNGRNSRTATKVTNKTTLKSGLDCSQHGVMDLPGLQEQQDRSYLASKRMDCIGYKNIVKTCFGCGDEF